MTRAALLAALLLAAAPARAGALVVWREGTPPVGFDRALDEALAAAGQTRRAADRRDLATARRAGKGLHAQLAALGRRGDGALHVDANRKRLKLTLLTAAGETRERRLSLPASPRGLAQALGALFRSTAPAPAAPPAPVEPAPAPAARRAPERPPAPRPVAAAPPTVADPAPRDDEAGRLAKAAPPRQGLELFRIALDGGVGARELAFGGGAGPGLRPHTAEAVALLGFHAAFYPLARRSTPFVSGLGIVADFLGSVGARTLDPTSGAEVDTRWLSGQVALHERLRLGRHAFSPWLGVAFGYGHLAWRFERDGRLLGELPSVEYHYLRPALDLRLPLGPVSFVAAGGVRAVLSRGTLGNRFPNGSAVGVDARAALEVRLPRQLALGLRAEYVHVFHAPNTGPDDPIQAAEAADRYVSGTAFLAWAPR